MSTKKPMLLVFAGPNGSGKSTIKSKIETVGDYTNADEISSTKGMDIKAAAQYADKLRYEAINNKKDLTFETVLSSEYKMKILRYAKSEGYFIKCIFMLTVDPYINVARVQMRVANGGHDVPKDKIIARYTKSLANIKELIDLCDILHVYDNTNEPERIIRKHKTDISIFPNKNWSENMIKELIQ